MDLNGKWAGTVIYGVDYKSHAGKELYFEFNLIQKAKEIAGTSMDTGGAGTSPDTAEFYGFYDNNKINFVKQYESRHYYLDGETKIDRSRKGPLIHYEGTFNPEKQLFSGTWFIEEKYRVLYIIPVTVRFGGAWSMKRVNEI